MGDDFDSKLGRMFADAPALPDAEAFAARVSERLDRGWALRRTMIGVGGLAAGVVVAWQFLAGRLTGDLEAVSDGVGRALNDGVERALGGFDQMMVLPAGGETLWLGAALAAVALTFVIVRSVETA